MDKVLSVSAVAIVIAAIYGWIANIIALINMLDGNVSAMFIARIVGIFVAPFGSILGFI